MEIELESCPFCGSNDVGQGHTEAYSLDSSYDWFGCKQCGAVFIDGDANDWNRRVTHADYKALEAKWQLLVERDTALTAELAECRKDAIRLSWLESECTSTADEHGVSAQLYFGTYSSYVGLRVSIDMAIARGAE